MAILRQDLPSNRGWEEPYCRKESVMCGNTEKNANKQRTNLACLLALRKRQFFNFVAVPENVKAAIRFFFGNILFSHSEGIFEEPN